MSMKPVFDVKLFNEPDNRTDQKRSQSALLIMFEALVNINQIWIKTHKTTTPPIYKAPVRYEREYGTELWCDIPTILEKGFGDCEDLAAWRCAEIREAGGKASPYVTYKKVNGSFHYHAIIKRAGINPKTGTYGKWLEDPSKRLGMGWEEDYKKVMIGRGVVPRSVFDNPAYANVSGMPADNFGGMGIRVKKDED